ncbi:MAG: polyprenol monophosphomannose synthase [Longispora sp.]|nr:polyprenol monophosphomannose synthase [Longispora sp. (in: high G+C Gram-positive bacteria)]
MTENTTPSSPAEEGYPGVGRVLVVIPTYNELENIRLIVDRVRRATPQVDILIADDNSPDGTGAVADDLAAADAQVNVLHRAGKEGLGAAYIAGFSWAKERNYDAVVEMDADGSHAPEQLHRLLDALRAADGVLGSRYISGGSVVNWPKRRLLLSRGGNLYARILLGMPLNDATGGYRAYRLPVLDKIDLASVISHGYCFQIDLTYRAYKTGCKLVEVPITFHERVHGVSKMNGSIIREALAKVTVWGIRDRLGGRNRQRV